MVQARPRFRNFEEYLTLEDPESFPEGACEYVDGELLELPPEARLNSTIAFRICLALVYFGISDELIHPGKCEVEVPVIDPQDPTTRYPDLVVLREEHLQLTQDKLTITREMPAPRLVVEVLSPGVKNRQRDLVDKRKQYAARAIPEYWLVDPENQLIIVLSLLDGQYHEHGVFQGEVPIQSPGLGLLPLTVNQLCRARR